MKAKPLWLKYNRETDFFPFLREQVANLARTRGLDADTAEDLGIAIAIVISSQWGGQTVYVCKSPVIIERHADCYSRWLRIRKQVNGSSHENGTMWEVAHRVAEETGYSARHVFRIVRDVEACLNPAVMEG